MKFLLALYILFFSFISSSFARDYSILYEQDAMGIMIIYHGVYKDSAEVIQFGGYEWFNKTYSNSNTNVETFIQPDRIGRSGDQKSYMKAKYKINKFTFKFSEFNGNEILYFTSKRAYQQILGFLSRNEIFSLASLNPGVSWYAGTFVPIKSTKDLIELSIKNQLTFCETLDYIELNQLDNNIDLQTNNVRNLMKEEGYVCNSQNLLNEKNFFNNESDEEINYL
tara:strand:- start:87 stop:758 length:672 start_codon:yes stop_codon:yes gene_type:complete